MFDSGMRQITNILPQLSVLFLSLILISGSPGIPSIKTNVVPAYDSTYKTIHVMVALCDNTYQGIVPVPAAIGNGQNPGSNLYWGCGYGVRTYFSNSPVWKRVKTIKRDSVLMERVIYRHRTKNYYLVADAYNGKYIKQCTINFLNACCGKLKDTILADRGILGIGGHSSLLAYVGHDGLMDFSLPDSFTNSDGKKRSCVILACSSRTYFTPLLKSTGSYPLVWTTGLMCPEAYTLHDIVNGFIDRKSNQEIRSLAANAYHRYQKCGEKAAHNLFVSGW